ncbi:MarR family transcriptional regulator [archaeon]|nr:MarR family transcriptional regulator [archaeon]
MNFVEMVLAAVEKNGEVCAQDIAFEMQVPKSIVAGVLNKLEAEGLLRKL